MTRSIILLGFIFLVFSASAKGQPDDKQRLEIVQKELLSHFNSKEFGKAQKLAEESLELSIKLFGTDGERTAVAHANLGTIQRERGKFKEAVEQLQKATDIRAKIPTSGAAKRIDVLESLAVAQFLAGKRQEAEQNSLLALEIAEKEFGAESKESFQSTLNTANFFALGRNYELADEFYLRSLKIAYNKFGPDAPEKESVEDSRGCLTDPTVIKPETSKAFQEARKQFFKDYDLAAGILNGKAVSLPRPAYPIEARSNRISGIIVVRVRIDEKGRVSETRAVCGHPSLARASEEAARKAKFTPTLKDGKPTQVKGMITYNFVAPR